MKYLAISIMTFLVGVSAIKAQTEKELSLKTETIFPKGEKITNNNFTGIAYLKMLINADSFNTTTVGNVSFEPKARTKWHFHPGGQILLVTDGVGYYQEKGQPKKILKKGNVIKCPPNIEHWHGASKNSHMVHLTISDNDKGAVVWLQHVTDEEYNK